MSYGMREEKTAISRYISYCLRSLYRIMVYPLSLLLAPSVVVVVVVIFMGHAGPHEDTLLIGRCQWFDPS